MESTKSNLFSISHIVTFIFSYIYQNNVLDNGLFQFTLLLSIHSILAYCIFSNSNIFPTCKSNLKVFIHVTFCFMMTCLIICITCVYHIKYFIGNDNPGDNIEYAKTQYS